MRRPRVRVIDVEEHVPGVQMGTVVQLVNGLGLSCGQPVIREMLDDFAPAPAPRPSLGFWADDCGEVLGTVDDGVTLGMVKQVGPLDRHAQAAPHLVGRKNQRDVAVLAAKAPSGAYRSTPRTRGSLVKSHSISSRSSRE